MFRRILTSTALCLLALLCQPAMALDDPMRPPGNIGSVRAGTGSGPAYTLSSTLIARDRRTAVINGRRVGLDEVIGGARVIEILPTQVRLLHQGKTLTLSLLPITIKKPVPVE